MRWEDWVVFLNWRREEGRDKRFCSSDGAFQSLHKTEIVVIHIIKSIFISFNFNPKNQSYLKFKIIKNNNSHLTWCIQNERLSPTQETRFLLFLKSCIKIAWKRSSSSEKNKTQKEVRIFYDLIIKRASFLWLQWCRRSEYLKEMPLLNWNSGYTKKGEIKILKTFCYCSVNFSRLQLDW